MAENDEFQGMNLQQMFAQALPGRFFLDENDPGAFEMYLNEKRWLEPEERVLSAEIPGKGNMNHVLRVHTPLRTFILKQARPWVERFPEIPAPLTRIESEGDFYSLVQEEAAWKASTPAILGMDANSHVLMMEDLGAGKNYSFLYQDAEQADLAEMESLAALLSRLHNGFIAGKTSRHISNIEMRMLNHHHIFNFPLDENNGLDLEGICPGLKHVSLEFMKDEKLKAKADTLGQIYLADGKHLLHGDFYPGSWLHTQKGIFVIDPEFAYFGPAEFDLGNFVAHLLLTGAEPEFIQKVFSSYKRPDEFSVELMAGFAGMEIIRRLIGIAQLPGLTHNASERNDWLKLGREWMLEPENSALIRRITGK